MTPQPYNPLLTLRRATYSVQITPGNFGQASIVTALGERHRRASTRSRVEHHDRVGAPRVCRATSRTRTGGCRSTWASSVFRQITPATNYQLGRQHRSSGSRRRSASTTGAQLLDAARVRLAVVRPVVQLRARRRRAPAARSRAQPVRHAAASRRAACSGRCTSAGATRTPRATSGASATRTASPSARRSTSPTRRSRATSPATPRRSTSRRTSRCPGCGTTSLALHAAGGCGGGNRGGRGPFYVGGFIDLPVVNVVQNSLIQGGVELRGYPVVAEAGQLLRALQRRVPLPDRQRRPRALDAARLPQPHQRRRVRRLRQRVRRPDHRRSSRPAWAASCGST